MIRQMGIAMAIVTALVAPALAQDRLDPVQTREELVAAQIAALRVLKEARIYLEQRRAPLATHHRSIHSGVVMGEPPRGLTVGFRFQPPD